MLLDYKFMYFETKFHGIKYLFNIIVRFKQKSEIKVGDIASYKFVLVRSVFGVGTTCFCFTVVFNLDVHNDLRLRLEGGSVNLAKWNSQHKTYFVRQECLTDPLQLWASSVSVDVWGLVWQLFTLTHLNRHLEGNTTSNNIKLIITHWLLNHKTHYSPAP